jgi:hypothetical protein
MEPWSGEWLLNYVYGASSNYGHSVGWPLFWLMELFAVGLSTFLVISRR